MSTQLSNRLRKIETKRSNRAKAGQCHMVVIDEAPTEAEREARIDAALAEQGVERKPEDLVIVRTITDPAPQTEKEATA